MTESSTRPPAIDIDMLTMALQAGDLDTSWWLDKQSGAVIPAPEVNGDAGERKLMKEKQRTPERYVDIEPIDGSVYHELMESYIATLQQADICTSLYEALKHEQAAWHFKNALAQDPACEDNWYAFKDQFYALQARQWLRERGLEAIEYKDEDSKDCAPQLILETTTGDMKRCLELVVAGGERQRRYLIWQQKQQVLLTAFNREADQDELLLAEIEINEHQLSGINEIIESYQPSINTEPLNVNINVHLFFSNEQTSGEIQGNIGDGSMFKRLVTMFDMLLAVAAL